MEITEIWEKDSYLKPYKPVIWRRHQMRLDKALQIRGTHDRLAHAINNHLYYGIHKTETGWICREWAPNAVAIYLTGECNGWKKDPGYAFIPVGSGNWELILPSGALQHGQLYKWLIEWPGGSGERLPAYARRCVQDPETKIFSAQVWDPAEPYRWKYNNPHV